MIVAANVLDGPFRFCCLHNNRMEMAHMKREKKNTSLYLCVLFPLYRPILDAMIKNNEEYMHLQRTYYIIFIMRRFDSKRFETICGTIAKQNRTRPDAFDQNEE